jgi:predicted transcriptional regulator
MDMKSIGKKLDISTASLMRWKETPPKLSRVDKLTGTVVNGYEVLKEVNYNKISCRCVKCGTIDTKYLSSIEQKKVRCKGCKPSLKSIYLNDVKDLSELGLSGGAIAEVLGIGISSVASIRHKLGFTKDEDYEYTFKEIGDYLSLTEHQARAAYKSGMEKLEKYLGELDLDLH